MSFSKVLDAISDAIGRALAAILITGGLVLLVSTGHQAIQAVRSSSWPTVEGRVTESRVVERTGRRNRKTHVPRITYRYSVDGIEQVGRRLFFGSQYPASWTTGAEEYIARYPPGTPLQVHVDPGDAATSVVEAGLKSSIMLPMFLSILMIGTGVLVGFEKRLRMARLARRKSASTKAT